MNNNNVANARPGGRGSLFFGLLVIIVIGIVAALRIDDWYTRRTAMETERLYLARLQADIEAMFEFSDQLSRNLEERRELIVSGARALQSCELPPSVKDDFDLALLYHQGIPPLYVQRATYDAMVAGGVLAKLSDQSLARDLQSLFADVDGFAQRVAIFAVDLGRASEIVFRRVSFSLAPVADLPATLAEFQPGPYGMQVAYDFDALCADSEFRNAYVEIYDSNEDRLWVSTALRDKLQAVSESISSNLSEAGG